MIFTDKDYYGKAEQIDHDTIEDVLGMGAPVRFRKCEHTFLGAGMFTRWGTRRTEWEPLRSMKQLENLCEWSWDDRLGWKWVELSYHLTDGQHALLEAKARTRDEELRKQMKAEHEEWCRQELAKIEELAKKKPWIFEPDRAAKEAEEEWYDRMTRPSGQRY